MSQPIHTRERFLMLLILVLAALQLRSKRQPELQDKFVICQVPFYTEGEDSLCRTIDSQAALNHNDKRKLIFIFCDGNIIGSRNERTSVVLTPLTWSINRVKSMGQSTIDGSVKKGQRGQRHVT